MGIFGDLDLASASDDPFSVNDGTYEAVVTKAEVRQNKNETDNFLVLEYTIEDDGNMSGRKVSEWKKIPKQGAEDFDRAASFLKQRLLSIGIPNERINSFEPDDALGADVVITVKTKDGYANVNKVATLTDEQVDRIADGGNAFSSL